MTWNGTFLQVDSMVVNWWIVAFLRIVILVHPALLVAAKRKSQALGCCGSLRIAKEKFQY